VDTGATSITVPRGGISGLIKRQRRKPIATARESVNKSVAIKTLLIAQGR
jgi:hypothetical protein